MDKEKLQELLARVEKATGPDRVIDGALHAMFGDTPEGARKDTYSNEWFTAPGIQWQHPSYTASIDAALALVGRVLPGWVVGVSNWFTDTKMPYADMASQNFINSVDNSDHEHADASAATMPLAILAALLKALIAQEATQ